MVFICITYLLPPPPGFEIFIIIIHVNLLGIVLDLISLNHCISVGWLSDGHHQ